MEEVNIQEIENIKILQEQLKQEMSIKLRLEKLNLLRYYLSKQEKEKDKVKYQVIGDKLEYSESIKIAIVITQRINQAIEEEQELEEKKKLLEILYANYYYLARYLYNYFAVAIEFGIPKEKQFLAPRTCVLNYINYELTKFYYKDRAIMTISMPQGSREDRAEVKGLWHGQ